MIHKTTVSPGTAAPRQHRGLIIQNKMAELESALVLCEKTGCFEASNGPYLGLILFFISANLGSPLYLTAFYDQLILQL